MDVIRLEFRSQIGVKIVPITCAQLLPKPCRALDFDSNHSKIRRELFTLDDNLGDMLAFSGRVSSTGDNNDSKASIIFGVFYINTICSRYRAGPGWAPIV